MKRLIFCISFLCLLTQIANTQKNDTLYLSNGDRVTGEFKKYETGQVYLKTDALFNVYVKADHVNTVYSGKYFEFRTQSGIRYYGSIQPSEKAGSIDIVTVSDTITKPLWDIIQISPINQSVFQRIDGSLDFGLSYTRSIDVFQYNLNGSATYRSTHVSTSIDVTSILSDAGDDDLAKNNDLGINMTRYLPKKWFIRTQIDFQQNTQLNLDRRFQIGPALGYDLVRTTPMRLYGLAGILLNQERLIEPQDETFNIEGLFSLYYTWYRYRHPKIDISSGVDFYPSMTVGGRYRIDYDISTKYEILTDVFFNLSYYLNFDSHPDKGGTSKNDSGVVASISYTF
jgi:hypothetical protein